MFSARVPPRWSADDFQRDRDLAADTFRKERMSEPLEVYGEVYEARRDAFDDLVERTVDLTLLRYMAVEVLSDPALLEVVRYVAGPPISADDLMTVAEASLAQSRLAASPEMAERVMETILLGLDARRFPWLNEGRPPTEAEREAAAVATTALIASQRVNTERRKGGGAALEQQVASRLDAGGMTRVDARTIRTTDDAPGIGEYCGESLFGSRKADLVVRLFDRRIFAIECKVSNSSTNSIKRLNNDAAQKAVRWLEEFGIRTAVPAAVLAGVFKVKNLEDAQGAGLAIFWAHNLDALWAFVESTKG